MALAPCFLYFARRLGIHPGAARVGFILLCLNQEMLGASSSILSEPVFTAVTLAALLLVQYSQTATRGAMGTAVLGGVAAAGAYWIRYAGLLLIALLAVLCALLLIQRRRPQFIRAAISLSAAFLCIAPILARNYRLVGSWRGYNTKAVFHPAGIAKLYLVSMYHVLFGSGLVRQTLPFAALCAICLIALGVAAIRRQGEQARVSASIPALFASVYTIGMIYLGVTSDIGFGERMFVPLLPVLLLLGAAVFSKWPPAIGRATAIAIASVLAIAYGASNLIGSSSTRTVGRHVYVQSAVSGKMREILDRDPSVLVSADGQAAGYGLGRPVIGLVGTDYGNLVWTGQDVQNVMRRYGCRHLLLFPGIDTFDGQQTSPFLSALARGEYPPWLQVEAANGRAILYEFRGGPDLPDNR